MQDAGKKLDAASPFVLSMFRMVTSLLLACHGAVYIFGVFGGPDGGRPSVGSWPSWWAGVIELTGGVLVLCGIGETGTRIAAVANSGTMAYAYFSVHQEQALWPIENGGELAVAFCWSFLLIATLGPGPWSLTALLTRAAGPTPVPLPEPAPESAPAPAATAPAKSAG